MTDEFFEKAKAAKSAEELLSLAKANGVELTKEDAEECFAKLNKSGELSDEELDNVAGGGCQTNTLVQINGDLKEGDLVQIYRHSLSGFLSCKCGNGTFRVTKLSSWFKSVQCVCSQCGAEFVFFDKTGDDEIHKILL